MKKKKFQGGHSKQLERTILEEEEKVEDEDDSSEEDMKLPASSSNKPQTKDRA